MHNNFYFLRQLCAQLDKTLKDATVVECFSQNKDELIIVFQHEHGYFTIKAHLLSTFSCLAFPRDFHRARKNSIDLFPEIIGSKVETIQQYTNERSFAIHFNDSKSLLFKMHGNKSNIILFDKNEKTLFKNSLVADEGIELSKIDREIDFSRSAFKKNIASLKKLYFTFGPIVWKYLNENGFEKRATEDQWEMLIATIEKLNNPEFYTTKVKGERVLSLLPIGEILKQSLSPIEAVNEFFYSYTQTHTFESEKQKALASLQAKLKASNSFLNKSRTKLKELKEGNTYKTWADLLMANLYVIPERATKISLPDFQDASQMIDIPLSENLSPQKNAERYYRKSKNHQLEIDRLAETITAKEHEVAKLILQVSEINEAQDLKNLRQQVGELGLEKKKQTAEIILPYRSIEFKGYQILIGKNAKANDDLTLKYSYKEDLWLHAKDVSGSHVLIKYKSSQPFPKDVIERAAQLAAFFSKRKSDSLCPVAYTPKKYVRKRKGDPAGLVVVEKETVILVEPKGI